MVPRGVCRAQLKNLWCLRWYCLLHRRNGFATPLRTAANYETTKSLLIAQESCSQPVPPQLPPRAPLCPHPPEGFTSCPGLHHTACALWGNDIQPKIQQKLSRCWILLRQLLLFMCLTGSFACLSLSNHVNFLYKLNNQHLHNSKSDLFILIFEKEAVCLKRKSYSKLLKS